MLNYKAIFILLMFAPITAYAGLDSYSFVHVTIETPWAIFIFLCFLVLAPFVLMAILLAFCVEASRQKKQSRS